MRRPCAIRARVSYSAAIERSVSPSALIAGRAEKAQPRVVLCGGAAWIWNLATEVFPGAMQIVELLRAKVTSAKPPGPSAAQAARF